MVYRAEFRCLAGCEGGYPLTQPIYQCPRCGGLLDVVHDIEALRDRTAQQWRSLFEQRMAGRDWPYTSGVWSKHEWVAPDLSREHIVSTDEGRSSLFRAQNLAPQLGIGQLWVKLCGNSHSGSFKDLGMTVLVSTVRQALAEGVAISAIGCASTGDTSAALAAYGALAKLPVVVLLPRGKVSTAQLVQPLAAGAKVFALDTDFDGCMAIITQLAERGLLYLANSKNALRIEGQKTVALDICRQLNWQPPDWVVLPSGNLGNGYAMYRGFRMLRELGLITRLPRLALAQAQHANPLYRAFKANAQQITPVSAKTTVASAIQIGNPVSAPRAMLALAAMDGVVEQASEDDICHTAAMADRSGLYVCPHTAVALAAARKLRANNTIQADDTVVVVATANALKFTEFKVRYHEGSIGGVRARLQNQPLQLAADLGVVVDAINALRA